jgi:hypothetical protein
MLLTRQATALSNRPVAVPYVNGGGLGKSE